MTALTVHAPPTETSFRALGGGIGDPFAIAAGIAELADPPDARRAVAAITAMITERTGHCDLAPDPRDVPLVVRQREFAVAARRWTFRRGPGPETLPGLQGAHNGMDCPAAGQPRAGARGRRGRGTARQ